MSKTPQTSPIITVFQNMLTIINSGAGRDKLCRLIQYFLHAFMPILAPRGAHFKDLITRLGALKGSCSHTRKVLRFGKEIPLIVGIRNRLRQHEQKPIRMVEYRTMSDLALMLYFATDHPLYFHSIGLWKYSPGFVSNLSYINNVFWLLSSIFDMMVTLVEISHVQGEIQKLSAKVSNFSTSQGEDQLDQKQQLKKLRREHLSLWLNLIRNIVDLPAIFHFMGYTKRWSAEMAGTGGTIASLISLYKMWGN